MTDIQPFRALRYAQGKVELSDVLAPVYDVVAPGERAALWDSHPHAAVRLELTREVSEEAHTDYLDVAERLAAWRSAGVLERDAAAACYVLRQRFEAPDGRQLARLGFFAALRLEDYAARVVLPHERTLPAPRADRLKLQRATRANLSSILLLYEDRDLELDALLEAALETGECVRATDTAGVQNELAPLRNPDAIATLQAFMAARPVVIADGHHRYETALAFRDEERSRTAAADAPCERLLACFVNAHAEGSLLLPIHRVLRKLTTTTRPDAALSKLLESGWRQRVAPVKAKTPQDVALALRTHLAPHAPDHAFALDDGKGALHIFARARDEEITVRKIHRQVLGEVFGLDEKAIQSGAVAFPKSTLQAAEDVRAGRGALALYLNALSPDDIFRVTAAGETLPQKSSYFAPKLPTGLLFRTLEGDA